MLLQLRDNSIDYKCHKTKLNSCFKIRTRLSDDFVYCDVVVEYNQHSAENTNTIVALIKREKNKISLRTYHYFLNVSPEN